MMTTSTKPETRLVMPRISDGLVDAYLLHTLDCAGHIDTQVDTEGRPRYDAAQASNILIHAASPKQRTGN